MFESLSVRLFPFADVHRSRPRQAFRLLVELLESRTVPSTLQFMTYNVNEGTDHVHLLAALQQGTSIPAAVSQDFADVVASDIPDRALNLAQVILDSAPDVVGLQEASVYTVNGVVKYDILNSILNDLNAGGPRYKLLEIAPALSAQLPDASGNVIGQADQNAILVRLGDLTNQLRISNVQEGNFAAHATLSFGGLSVPVYRSWASADFTLQGNSIHFVTAHLESLDPRLAEAQALELLAGPAQSSLPVVVGADFNTPADGTGAAYNDFASPATGFVDAWKARHPDDPGYTWGPQPDPHSPDVDLTQRIDFLFVRGARVLHTQEVGFQNYDQAAGDVWPSDHAAVVTMVKFNSDNVNSGPVFGAQWWDPIAFAKRRP